MQDFETHPAGTADLVKMQQNLEHWRQEVGKLHSRVAMLTDQLTRANAATAAAYEVAAGVASFRHDENKILRATWATPSLTGLDDVSDEIRALATTDQTAALDRLIAEAEARVWERAERIARNVGVPVGAGDGCGTYIPGTSADAARAILAASKKGGV